ncbi:hypothetical protein P1X14_02675 [Sphingomonas sp. AOB5]|uniref:hypothetical protein n=1 Tax=Sphingomonas sp. AOB5 TaxID=3034017 RepID=UPI0023F8C63C|nr:hypothetical protein [Sphingomonas sp. AOB5]MDF7774140.1 hypothetical protein [Sphingomonas sp. AOB5]
MTRNLAIWMICGGFAGGFVGKALANGLDSPGDVLDGVCMGLAIAAGMAIAAGLRSQRVRRGRG